MHIWKRLNLLGFEPGTFFILELFCFQGVARSVSGDFHQYGQTTERQGRFRSVESTIRRDGGQKRRSASILSDSRAINTVPSCFG